MKCTVCRHEMFAPHERILLGVSGGKDSMAAWDLLIEMGYDVLAVHIPADRETEAVGLRNCAECGYKTLREECCYVCALRRSAASRAGIW